MSVCLGGDKLLERRSVLFENVSLVTVNTYALDHDERFFADPERYDPDRFAPGWEERIPRYAYLPFGGGPPITLAMPSRIVEARLILATIAQRYRL